MKNLKVVLLATLMLGVMGQAMAAPAACGPNQRHTLKKQAWGTHCKCKHGYAWDKKTEACEDKTSEVKKEKLR